MYLRLVSPLKTVTSCCRRSGGISRRLSCAPINQEACIDPNQQLNFIHGKRESPSGEHGTMLVTEPASGRVMCEVKESGHQDVDRAVEAAKDAFECWSSTSWMERGKIISATARIVRSRLKEIAAVEVADSGKPFHEACWDIDGCATVMEFYAGLAPSISGRHMPQANGSFAYTRREPLGVIAGIGAWNYPFQVCSWKVAPALACGNTFVFKPSPLTPLTAVMLAEIFVEAGLPPGAFNVIQGGGLAGHLLSSHPDVDKVTFTGSVETGKKIMSDCSAGIKKVTLELGGKSPLIIFEDANMENAVKGSMMANFLTQGQVCSNAARVYVEESILDKFLEEVVKCTSSIRVGDPIQSDTQMGALISEAHLSKVLSYVELGKKEGAKVLCGGERLSFPDPKIANGFYMSPCVMTECTDNMRIVREEIFGPVMTVMPFKTEREVIQRANNTEFGLAGGVFTKDLARAHRVVAKIKAGSLWINNFNVIPAEMPFGGYKMSGFGRECGEVALDYYTQVKSVYVEAGDVESPF